MMLGWSCVKDDYEFPQDLNFSEDAADLFFGGLVFEDDLHGADVAGLSLHTLADFSEGSVAERRP